MRDLAMLTNALAPRLELCGSFRLELRTRRRVARPQVSLAPQHGAGAPDGLDPIAKLARFAAGLSRQANAVERSPAAAAQD